MTSDYSEIMDRGYREKCSWLCEPIFGSQSRHYIWWSGRSAHAFPKVEPDRWAGSERARRSRSTLLQLDNTAILLFSWQPSPTLAVQGITY
jgi:hypothetical protein